MSNAAPKRYPCATVGCKRMVVNNSRYVPASYCLACRKLRQNKTFKAWVR